MEPRTSLSEPTQYIPRRETITQSYNYPTTASISGTGESLELYTIYLYLTYMQKKASRNGMR